MAINPAAFSATSISEAGRAVIEILGQPPKVNVQLDPPENPGRVVGYYNTTTDKVELYVASGGGNFWIRMS